VVLIWGDGEETNVPGHLGASFCWGGKKTKRTRRRGLDLFWLKWLEKANCTMSLKGGWGSGKEKRRMLFWWQAYGSAKGFKGKSQKKKKNKLRIFSK